MSYQKKVFFAGKVPQNVTGKFGKFEQISFAPPKIACS